MLLLKVEQSSILEECLRHPDVVDRYSRASKADPNFVADTEIYCSRVCIQMEHRTEESRIAFDIAHQLDDRYAAVEEKWYVQLEPHTHEVEAYILVFPTN